MIPPAWRVRGQGEISMFKPIVAVFVIISAAEAASAAGSTEFSKFCEAKVAVATCGCIVNELLRTRDGQIVLDTGQVVGRPASEQQATGLALLNKYGLKASELKAIIGQAKPMLDAAYERCK